MATSNCNDKLSSTQVRNPKLPVPDGKDNDSFIESVAWGRGESVGVSTLSGAVFGGPALLLTGFADIFLTVPHSTYAVSGLLFMAVFVFAMWCVRIAPQLHPPVDLGSIERKQAYQAFHALPLNQQSDVSAAFDIYMDADRSQRYTYSKATELWNQTYYALKERERLLAPPKVEETDHRLEQAKQDLEVLEGTVKQLKENNTK